MTFEEAQEAQSDRTCQTCRFFVKFRFPAHNALQLEALKLLVDATTVPEDLEDPMPEDEPSAPTGSCKRQSPVPAMVHTDITRNLYPGEGGWPTVSADDWCGEWAPVRLKREGA
jgi:hypothetical protein